MAEFHRTEEFPSVEDWREECVTDRGLALVWSSDATTAPAHFGGWGDDVREHLTRRSRQRTKRSIDDVVAEWADEDPDALRQLFEELADTWRRETKGAPFFITQLTHWAYLRIIGLGPKALPLILRELERETDHWFGALNAISGEDPAEGVEEFEEAAVRWLEWGRATGLLT